MKSVIYAVIAASVLQIVAVCFMTGYVYHRSVSEAAYFAALAQSHSEVYTDTVALRYYNQIQQERSAEREDLNKYIDKRIDLRLSQAIKTTGIK